MAFLEDIYSNDIYIDEENILKIQRIYEYKNNLEYIGWGLALIFTTLVVLLTFSFLTYNVSDSQKTVGILRALGVNKRVIVKIFVLEALYMTCSAFLVQFIGSFGVVKYINLFLCNNLQVNLKIFGREIKIIGFIFMFTIFVGVISVVSPVLSMFKKEIIKLIKG